MDSGSRLGRKNTLTETNVRQGLRPALSLRESATIQLDQAGLLAYLHLNSSTFPRQTRSGIKTIHQAHSSGGCAGVNGKNIAPDFPINSGTWNARQSTSSFAEYNASATIMTTFFY